MQGVAIREVHMRTTENVSVDIEVFNRYILENLYTMQFDLKTVQLPLFTD